ncbi:tRNA (adenosine(37)-N6)-threonylcarbamoyltransferase complex dimerization subunit type 1 TsaB [Microvirga terricola]|uniref:tRNA (Adenosine(37)-N6)-threonylcarbamoyltransferase complex dimerization subunit type 1 TsaB n=1 Tax=Microvirga terricola TaxID=2719797 RepID=A0ABX0V6S7_9HYPH|nr:tRNA (adenosine(37)-N6)-threonylcarbamoyltransferase complex dimerization subunit type 1 TsaB [Microvirga terricola]NIX75542.1 tRNA (adenosine(37)-N6)-threonylcarbamoyltransferase complex dimerization subunit type 1 TsaB [Microvirga terricola]
MRVLAIDTALGACSACIFQVGETEPLASESIAMERGHAEALLPLLDRLSSKVEGGFDSLGRVAVTVGPGSYTGLRVGISAARGIGLALGIPVIGVATLSAYLAPLMAGNQRGLFTAAIDAKHGHMYIQAIAFGGRTIIPPSLMNYRDALRLLGSGPLLITGSAAPILAAEARANGIEAIVSDTPHAPDIAWVARLGAIADPAQALPKPLYLRDPDAKPQDGARIARR